MHYKSVFVFLLLTINLLQAENIIYPSQAEAVWDVTQPPYNADNTGTEDCTEILIRMYDDFMQTVLDSFNATLDYNEKRKGRRKAMDPRLTPKSRIFYFPNGIYKVSNTIVYSLPNMQNQQSSEMCRQIHFRGQSEKGAIIKLIDNAPGFEKGAGKPVVSFMRRAYLDTVSIEDKKKLFETGIHKLPGLHSNVAFSNLFENMTIDIGKGNPGAIGLLFHCSNNGAVRNITIKSSDPEYAGDVGLAITMGKPMGAYSKHITIEGFDVGIKVNDFMLYTVYEHIRLSHQKVAGFQVLHNPVSIRNLVSNNTVPAVQLTGQYGHVVLVDSKLKGGDASVPAIDFRNGFLFARNIKTDGYQCAIGNRSAIIHKKNTIDEFSSHGIVSLFPDQKQKTLNLPIKETPDLPWPQNEDDWVSVNAFGAIGDGFTDDTDAIQQAMNSGKKVIYFQPGLYFIDSTITIPPTVERVNFMFADLKNGDRLRHMKNAGMFKIIGNSKRPLIIEDLFAWFQFEGSHYLIDHASTRTLILSDLHTQHGASYINTVSGGTVYIENVSCTTTNERIKDNNFTFRGQNVWARQINPERGHPEILNDGGQLWILGFKTEKRGTSFKTINGGKTEVLGGVMNDFGRLIKKGDDNRVRIINRDSNVSVIACTNGDGRSGCEYIIQEIRDGMIKELTWDKLPNRFAKQVIVPLYVGYK